MSIELHVLAGSALVETFRLMPGTHLLGSSEAADLLLSFRDAPTDVCQVELSPDGAVTLGALNDTPLRRWDGVSGFCISLRNGDLAEIGGLRLVLLARDRARDVVAAESPEVPPTAPSTGIRPPVRESLALKVRTSVGTRIVRIEAPVSTFGRAPGQTVTFFHPEVSREHARLVMKADGPWIEAAPGTHGTFLNGTQITTAAWPLNGLVRLSAANDAPVLELMPLVDALAEEGQDEWVAPIRGRSRLIQQVRAQVLRYATAEQPLLIRGETGTGKELVAQALARGRGPRRPFRPVNCGAFQATLIEAELFGYRKGAFTGATQEQKGQFQATQDGTLLLDEIGELPLALQPKLLRVLETGEVQRLGETHTVPVKARVLAATHRDLGAMVTVKEFREDLYHRIAVLEIVIPPLRERPEDIPDLVRLFLGGRSGRSAAKIMSDAAMERLLGQPWRGNVRQLKHVVERAALDTEGMEIGPDALTLPSTSSPAPVPIARESSYPAYRSEIERAHCEWAMAETQNNVTGAARLLGMSQSTFRRRLIQHGIFFPQES